MLRVILSLVLGLAVSATGCADGSSSLDGARSSIEVVASFYPLAFAAERVGGDAVSVTNLTPPGVEPHDLELTPDQLEAVAAADIVVYLGGRFQPAVEDAVAAEATGMTIDVLEGIEHVAASPGDDAGQGIADPHVWLDPTSFSGVIARIADGFGSVSDVDAFVANADELNAKLRDLDEDFRAGLADCGTRVMITNHAAFGYLAAAYGLEQRAISGISPESEPDPQRIAELAAEARAEGVTTIFTETLVSVEVAETLATEAGIGTAVLSPLEGLTDEQVAAGDDYLSVMRQNLEALRDGLVCS